MKIIFVLFFLTLLGGCATTSSPYKTVEFINYKTGKIGGTCDQPLDSFLNKADVEATLKLAYEAKSELEKIDFNSDGNLTVSYKSATETVRLISRQNFEYMGFLYPFCKANAEGRMDDQNYIDKMLELIDLFIKDHEVTVSLSRKADFSNSGCLDAGARVYRNLITDTLIFSEPIEYYIAQAYTNDGSGAHSVEVSYVVDGKAVTPGTLPKKFFGNSKRKSVKIPVHGKILQVKYNYKQTPSNNDDEWGLSFVSSLPITKLSASTELPPGKKVFALHEKYSSHARAFEHCNIALGETPNIECSTFSNEPNVPNHLVWKWNLFEGC